MKRPQTYINGAPELPGQHTAARGVLVAAGLYSQLGNFGPHFRSKVNPLHTIVEVFERDGYEFTIVEYEAMSFSLGSLSVSVPRRTRAAWFQPVIERP